MGESVSRLLMRGLGLAILLTACSVMSEVEPTPGLAPLPTQPTSPLPMRGVSPLPAATPSPGSVPTATIRSQLGVVKRAVADLADRLEIPIEAVQIISVTQNDFPVDDLGCGAVRPAFVTGWEIVLEANHQQYIYHAHGGQLVACDTNQ